MLRWYIRSVWMDFADWVQNEIVWNDFYTTRLQSLLIASKYNLFWMDGRSMLHLLIADTKRILQYCTITVPKDEKTFCWYISIYCYYPEFCLIAFWIHSDTGQLLHSLTGWYIHPLILLNTKRNTFKVVALRKSWEWHQSKCMRYCSIGPTLKMLSALCILDVLLASVICILCWQLST